MGRVVGLLVGVNAMLGIATWFGIKFTAKKIRQRGERLLRDDRRRDGLLGQGWEEQWEAPPIEIDPALVHVEPQVGRPGMTPATWVIVVAFSVLIWAVTIFLVVATLANQ